MTDRNFSAQESQASGAAAAGVVTPGRVPPGAHGLEGPGLPPRRAGMRPRTIVLLAVIWMLLWGELSIFFALSGLLVGLIVTIAFPMPPVWFTGHVRPLRLLGLILGLLGDLIRASIRVVVTVLRPGPPPNSGVVAVHLRSDSDFYEALTSELVSLVPGTLVMEARRTTRTLYLHVLDVRSPQDLENARAEALTYEDRVLRALASKQTYNRAEAPK